MDFMLPLQWDSLVNNSIAAASAGVMDRAVALATMVTFAR